VVGFVEATEEGCDGLGPGENLASLDDEFDLAIERCVSASSFDIMLFPERPVFFDVILADFDGRGEFELGRFTALVAVDGVVATFASWLLTRESSCFARVSMSIR